SVRIAPLCVAVLLIGSLASCGAKSSSPSQVAVKVNKEEISVHQINAMLSRSGNIPQDKLKEATSAIVQRFVDQELLLQQASELKLDRDPNVMQTIDLARREILARAYVEQFMSKLPRPTDAKITDFYNKNAAMFARSRYYLREIAIQVPLDRIEEVLEHAKSSNTEPQQFGNWLNAQQFPQSVSEAVRSTEQLDPDTLQKLTPLKPNQGFIQRTPAGLLLIQVRAVEDKPVERATARTYIENVLKLQERQESVQSEIKRLRGIASIEYVGDYTPSAEAAQSASAPAPAEPAAAESGESPRSLLEEGAAKLK
ncbi:MAG: EpsD family peptidyl-prolyl cis-trans isomerase, partial [Azoarcus sp.]|nr:EpsD family peptidyl-prolyl cis-trans isomerase [Azoarcus sp.]